jgi:N-acetyl-beta-hexosaminidase
VQGQIVTQIIRQRIGERISALKISWRQASVEAGLGSGFIQDLITGRMKEVPDEAVTKLAAALKCSPAYLLGQPEEASHRLKQLAPETAQRPDAVMTLKIVDELLMTGHVDAAHLAVRRALKEIQAEQGAGSRAETFQMNATYSHQERDA